jgi:phosphohistidine phosphatase SixA
LSDRLDRRLFLAGGGAAIAFAATPVRAQADVLAQMRQGGLLLFMRHANAPGVGDPEHFRLEECATQRNLSDRGRVQATEVGARLKREGVSWKSVQSSRWCRCLDTARLAFGAGEPLDLLNSGFNDARAGRPDKTEELRRYLLTQPRESGNRIYVSHMLNIMRLLNVNTEDAEIVAARLVGDTLQTIGSLRPDA